MKLYASSDQYLAEQSEANRQELNRIRQLVIQLVPEAEESISYGMPAFKYKGKPLLYYAAFKDHLSVFPTSGPISEIEDQLKEFKTGKGTVSFTLKNPLPDSIIEKLVMVRVAQIESGS